MTMRNFSLPVAAALTAALFVGVPVAHGANMTAKNIQLKPMLQLAADEDNCRYTDSAGQPQNRCLPFTPIPLLLCDGKLILWGAKCEGVITTITKTETIKVEKKKDHDDRDEHRDGKKDRDDHDRKDAKHDDRDDHKDGKKDGRDEHRDVNKDRDDHHKDAKDEHDRKDAKHDRGDHKEGRNEHDRKDGKDAKDEHGRDGKDGKKDAKDEHGRDGKDGKKDGRDEHRDANKDRDEHREGKNDHDDHRKDAKDEHGRDEHRDVNKDRDDHHKDAKDEHDRKDAKHDRGDHKEGRNEHDRKDGKNGRNEHRDVRNSEHHQYSEKGEHGKTRFVRDEHRNLKFDRHFSGKNLHGNHFRPHFAGHVKPHMIGHFKPNFVGHFKPHFVGHFGGTIHTSSIHHVGTMHHGAVHPGGKTTTKTTSSSSSRGGNSNAAMEYIGSAIACSATSLVLDGAITSATENRELGYGEAYAAVGNCLVPFVGGLIGHALGDGIDPCTTPGAISYTPGPGSMLSAAEMANAYRAKYCQGRRR